MPALAIVEDLAVAAQSMAQPTTRLIIYPRPRPTTRRAAAASPSGSGIDDAGNETGYVYLELSEGDDAEAKRGLALLKRLVG